MAASLQCVGSEVAQLLAEPLAISPYLPISQVAQLLAEPLAISLYDKDASRLDRDDSLGKVTLPGHFLDTS